MGKDKHHAARKGKKKKDICCQKYLKKGKHCKGCPDAGECSLPEE